MHRQSSRVRRRADELRRYADTSRRCTGESRPSADEPHRCGFESCERAAESPPCPKSTHCSLRRARSRFRRCLSQRRHYYLLRRCSPHRWYRPRCCSQRRRCLPPHCFQVRHCRRCCYHSSRRPSPDCPRTLLRRSRRRNSSLKPRRFRRLRGHCSRPPDRGLTSWSTRRRRGQRAQPRQHRRSVCA
jgi:hypothetical protein